ncbi:hypothetical protein [Streptomyces lydicus]|uniref:hypothetical protein n=1 Tax=Streptomyces lydicus TaxID=47763 RepID=UPI00131D733B|nr:hypothetical protein [Streptomyces lydicus]
MPDAGQRVVLGAQAEHQLARSPGGEQRGGQLTDAPGDGEPGGLPQVRDFRGRAVFGQGGLRLVVQAVAQGQQPLADIRRRETALCA